MSHTTNSGGAAARGGTRYAGPAGGIPTATAHDRSQVVPAGKHAKRAGNPDADRTAILRRSAELLARAHSVEDRDPDIVRAAAEFERDAAARRAEEEKRGAAKGPVHMPQLSRSAREWVFQRIEVLAVEVGREVKTLRHRIEQLGEVNEGLYQRIRGLEACVEEQDKKIAELTKRDRKKP